VRDGAPVLAVSVPGDGFLRFCRAPQENFTAGEWVVIDGPLGQEPGKVIFGSDDVDIPGNVELRYTVALRLTEHERSTIDEHVEAARGFIATVVDQLSSIDPVLELSSLRLSLDGETLLCAIFGHPSEDLPNLERMLTEFFSRQVRLEVLERSAVFYGSVGRIAEREPGDEDLLERVGRGRLSGNPRPNGWPRLGSRVGAGAVSGVLLGISMRHDTATIRLDSGEEQAVPLSDVVVDVQHPEE